MGLCASSTAGAHAPSIEHPPAAKHVEAATAAPTEAPAAVALPADEVNRELFPADGSAAQSDRLRQRELWKDLSRKMAAEGALEAPASTHVSTASTTAADEAVEAAAPAPAKEAAAPQESDVATAAPAVAVGGASFEAPVVAQWVSDEQVLDCTACKSPFSLLKRRHHCRSCGQIFCSPCSGKALVLASPVLPEDGSPASPAPSPNALASPSRGGASKGLAAATPTSPTAQKGLQRVCDGCFTKLSRRPSPRRAKAAAAAAAAAAGAATPAAGAVASPLTAPRAGDEAAATPA